MQMIANNIDLMKQIDSVKKELLCMPTTVPTNDAIFDYAKKFFHLTAKAKKYLDCVAGNTRDNQIVSIKKSIDSIYAQESNKRFYVRYYDDSKFDLEDIRIVLPGGPVSARDIFAEKNYYIRQGLIRKMVTFVKIYRSLVLDSLKESSKCHTAVLLGNKFQKQR